MDNFLSTFLVVWRETFEALLVIFLLSTRLVKENLWLPSKKFVGLGIVIGIIFSVLSAVVLFKIDGMDESFLGRHMPWVLPVAASFMMAHMVFWMAKHGKEISGEIKELVQNQKQKTFFWGIAAFIAYAVAREGFETVIFLYSLSLKTVSEAEPLHFAWPALLGFAVSLLTVFILKSGLSYFNLKYFFRVTNIFLLGTAISLFTTGISHLIELEYLPTLKNPLWDTSSLIPASSIPGKFLNMFMGYTPQPSTTLVICYFLFCLFLMMIAFINKPTPKAA